MKIPYRGVDKIRFSCAYLFRIKLGDKFLLVMDEQGRGTYQPVGGVYKYYSDKFFLDTHATQCVRFGNNSDLDCDLRVIVPRKYASRFNRWYRKEKERETVTDLYREFKEELLDRIDFLNPADFETIEYRYLGEHIEYSRLNEHDMQIRIADVVEFLPTQKQRDALMELYNHDSSLYRFATKEEIYSLGATELNRAHTISAHTYKILPTEEGRLIHNRKTGKHYKCKKSEEKVPEMIENWQNIEKADMDKPFTFISYNSLFGRTVWDFCYNNTPPFDNLWIDKKQVSENWMVNVENALNASTCKKAVMFISREYLTRSTACYHEASMIVKNNIPHILVLVDVDYKYLKDAIKNWIYCDEADKEKLRVFKKLFHYDDDTGHINCSLFPLHESNMSTMWQAYSNL